MESEYIARAVRGDAEAFETLMTAYEKKIYCLCLRMMGNPHDGEDAAQEAMLRIWQKMSQYRGECAFSTWVYRVASSSCMDAIRKRSRQTQPSLEDMKEQGFDPGMTPIRRRKASRRKNGGRISSGQSRPCRNRCEACSSSEMFTG